MKTALMSSVTIAAISLSIAPVLAQVNNVNDQGTLLAPPPSMAEELVYLRDVIGLQTLRLDEAEQKLARQDEVITAQSEIIAELQKRLGLVELASTNNSAAIEDGYFGGGQIYTVRRGDTVGKIATAFDTTVSKIAMANRLAVPDQIEVGQRLVIPIEEAPAPIATAQQPTQERAKVANATTQQQREQQPTRTAANASSSERQAPQDRQEETIEQVGIRPEDEGDRPYLAIFSDVGGILTPRGTMYGEAGIGYSVSSDNRFFFQGIGVVEAVFVGALESTQSDRRSFSESLGIRYGITNRFEVNGRISYIERDDNVSGFTLGNDPTETTQNLDGVGIGDAEIGLNYQLNDGGKWPFVIANLRVKAPTGDGPFDINRNTATGNDLELATGSGFWTLEPSATFILSSDPAVISANFGYQFNLSTAPNQVIFDNYNTDLFSETTQTLSEFRPGNAFRSSIGVGLSLNEKLSLNFGYDMSFFESTTSINEIRSRDAFQAVDALGEALFFEDGSPEPERNPDGTINYMPEEIRFSESRTPTAVVGSFLFGGSYAVNDRLRFNLNASIGATDQAPDARVGLRATYKLFD